MIRTTAILTIAAAPAFAQDLTIVTDIAPVQALVQGIATPGADVDVLLPPGASPHDFSMRPSDAAGLSKADAVIWVGAGLTPWLARPIDSLAGGALVTSLLETPGWEPRENAAHMGDDEDHEDHDDHEGDHDHDHDDHADGGHDKHDDHAAEEGHDDDAHAHDHGPIDPHAWLDPVVAEAWSLAIAEALATADPDGAEGYRNRAIAQAAEIAALADALAPQVADIGAYILPHDAYGYFEARFGLDHAGIVHDADDTSLGPAHLAGLRDMVVTGQVACIYHEVGPVPGWVNTLAEGTDVQVLTLDPLGVEVAEEAAFYPALLTNLAQSFAACKGAS